MDRVVAVVVKVMVAWARLIAIMPFTRRKVNYWSKGAKLKILLVGYNGARNTGADVRVAAIVDQLEEMYEKDRIEISVMTLDIDNFKGYFKPYINLIKFSSIFFFDVLKACSNHHVAILCEGSTLKSKFANALTLFYCETAGIMKAQRKPCIAYGSEAGEMEPFLKKVVQKLFSEVYFIARTQNSLETVQALGIKGHRGTDTAWTFVASDKGNKVFTELYKKGWDGKKPLIGVAPINPFWWPVKPSLWKYFISFVTGNRDLQFQKWYFFSWSKDRKHRYEKYLTELAKAINEQVYMNETHVVIIGMEQLDEAACLRLAELLDQPASILLSREHDGFELAKILQSLSLLITSRYHACVLAMDASVPTVAVSMDERLDNIIEELGYTKEILCSVNDPDLAYRIRMAIEFLESHSKSVRAKTEEQVAEYLLTMQSMGNFLRAYIAQVFPTYEEARYTTVFEHLREEISGNGALQSCATLEDGEFFHEA